MIDFDTFPRPKVQTAEDINRMADRIVGVEFCIPPRSQFGPPSSPTRRSLRERLNVPAQRKETDR